MLQKPEFRLIIAGSRHFADYELLATWADHMLQNKASTHRIIIVSGTAKGADTLGEVYAKKRGYEIRRFPADWNTHGRAAGPKRNRQMGEYAHALLAFAKPTSRGTASMLSIAKELGLPAKHVVISTQQEDATYWQKVRIIR